MNIKPSSDTPGPLYVLKFGGTSVADKNAMIKAAKIVCAYKSKTIVVLSACSGVTNSLHDMLSYLRLAESHYPSSSPLAKQNILLAIEKLRSIKNKHDELIDTLLDSNYREEALSVYSYYFCELKNRLLGAILLRKISDTNANAMVSMGEYFSSAIFTAYLKQNDIKAQFIDSYDYLIQKGSKPNVDESLAKTITNNLSTSDTLVMQGYLMQNSDSYLDNFGRGGSDYSAALIGSILGAEQVDIYTDVDGVFSADPRLVSNARVLDLIGPRAMGMMARFGAKIMHPDSLMPATHSGVPVYIKNTFSDSKGTKISLPVPGESLSRLPTLTFSRDIVKISIDLLLAAGDSNIHSQLRSLILDREPLYYAESAAEIKCFLSHEQSKEILKRISNLSINPLVSNNPLLLITSLPDKLVFISNNNLINIECTKNNNNGSPFCILRDENLLSVSNIGHNSYLLELDKDFDINSLSSIHDHLFSIINGKSDV